MININKYLLLLLLLLLLFCTEIHNT